MSGRRRWRLASVALIGVAGLAVPPAVAGRDGEARSGVVEILGLLNAARAERSLPRLRWVEPLSDAALRQVESLVQQAASFPSRRPELLTELPYEMADLSELLAGAGYDAAEARATLVVGAAAPERTFGRLLETGDPFVEEFLANDLPDLGVGVAELDGVGFFVLILARSAAELFATGVAPLADLVAVRRRLLAETNAARSEHRRPPLRQGSCLDRAAQQYAERLLAESFFGHVGPEGDNLADRVRQQGCRLRLLGENLAEGPFTAAEAVVGWLESPRHRRNLLDPQFTRVGFGLAYGPAAEGHRVVWVQVLGG